MGLLNACVILSSSKLVAEKLLEQARTRGIPVSIYRPGFISSHSLTGVSNVTDFDNRLIRGIIAMKSAPNSDSVLEMSPVDWVSDIIVHLVFNKVIYLK